MFYGSFASSNRQTSFLFQPNIRQEQDSPRPFPLNLVWREPVEDEDLDKVNFSLRSRSATSQGAAPLSVANFSLSPAAGEAGREKWSTGLQADDQRHHDWSHVTAGASKG